MSLYENTEFTFISPVELKMPRKITDFLEQNNIKYEEINDYKK